MKITGIILWIIAVVMLCLGCGLIQVKSSDQSYEKSTAVVTGIESTTYYSDDYQRNVTEYCVKFTYKTQEGQSVSFEQGKFGGPCKINSTDYKVGEHVPVYYDPSNPSTSAELTGTRNGEEMAETIGAYCLIALAILCIVIGTVLFVKGRAKN